MKNLIGYDLDGTICEKSEIDKKFFHCNGIERRAFKRIRDYHIKNARLISNPSESKYVIITSRKPSHFSLTMQWLNKKGLKPSATYFMDNARTRRNMIEYKTNLINSLMLTRYHEDDEKIVTALKKKCINTEIIAVKAVVKKYKIKDFIDSSKQTIIS